MSGDRKDFKAGVSLWYDCRDMGEVKGAAFLLLNALCSRVNPDGVCWPSYEQLMEDTRLSESALKRASRELVGDGWVTKRTRRNRSNIWIVDSGRITALADARRAERKTRKREEQLRLADRSGDERDMNESEPPDSEPDESGAQVDPPYDRDEEANDEDHFNFRKRY